MNRSHSALTLLAASAMFVSPSLGQEREGERPDRSAAITAFADRMMSFDVNNDGKLALEEMDTQNAKTFMARADANKDGFLTRDELIAMAMDRAAGRRATVQTSPPQGGDGDAVEEISFHDAMEQAGRGLKGFRRSPMDGSSRKEDLMAVQQIQLGLLFAKARVSSVEMSEASKEEFGEDDAAHKLALRIGLIKMIMKTLEFEGALVDGDTEKAKEVFESIGEMRGNAHDLFEPEEEDHDEEAPVKRRINGGEGGGGGEG